MANLMKLAVTELESRNDKYLNHHSKELYTLYKILLSSKGVIILRF
jgi:hypothetical protein